jgi:hypothetical protein
MAVVLPGVDHEFLMVFGCNLFAPAFRADQQLGLLVFLLELLLHLEQPR